MSRIFSILEDAEPPQDTERKARIFDIPEGTEPFHPNARNGESS